MPGYGIVKLIHVGAAALSISLFTLRGAWMLTSPERLAQRWVKIVPHVVDTLLLVSALWLAWQLGTDGTRGWLAAKVAALFVYIALGTIALKRGRTRKVRVAAFVAALATFGYIVSVAMTKSPLGLLLAIISEPMAADPFSEPSAPGFDDPLGMLTACHRRIERQLATLDRLQRHLPENGCDGDARIAAAAILKYFDGPAPNHHADEETSLFPRLEAAAAAQARALLADLEFDHVALAARWRRLRPLLAGIVAGNRANLSPKQVDDLRAAYAAHIAREESELIPLAARVLDDAAFDAIGLEMAARRGTRFGAGRPK